MINQRWKPKQIRSLSRTHDTFFHHEHTSQFHLKVLLRPLNENFKDIIYLCYPAHLRRYFVADFIEFSNVKFALNTHPHPPEVETYQIC